MDVALTYKHNDDVERDLLESRHLARTDKGGREGDRLNQSPIYGLKRET